jgi:hypothetical protein
MSAGIDFLRPRMRSYAASVRIHATFPEQANLDDASRQKLLQEWKTTVYPADEWNARVGAAKVDYKRIGIELVALTVLCAVGFVLSPRAPATKL